MAEVFELHCHENCMGCPHEKYQTAKGISKCPTVKARKRIIQRSIYQMEKATKLREVEPVK